MKKITMLLCLMAFACMGAKADQFKLKYIDAFNQMEKQLQQQKPLSLPEQISLCFLLNTFATCKLVVTACRSRMITNSSVIL